MDEFEYDYYDDNKYLGYSDCEAINYIYSRKNLCKLFVKADKAKWGKSIAAYDEYVEQIAHLIQQLSIPNNAISASIILNFLTKLGIFSNNYELTMGISTEDAVFGVLGINVVAGQAVCRHFSSFQSDVLKKLALFSEPYYCYLSSDDIESADTLGSNHAINLIEYKNNLYGYDAYNDAIFRFVGDKKMKELFKDSPYYAFYKPYMNVIYNNETISSVNNLVAIFDTLKDFPVIDNEEYNEILDTALQSICENKQLINDFNTCNKKYIKRITDNL